MAPGSDPQVVEELDPVLVPETRHQVLGLRAEPEIIEPGARGRIGVAIERQVEVERGVPNRESTGISGTFLDRR